MPATPLLIPYLQYSPALAMPFELAPSAAAIGRTVAGGGLVLAAHATLRGDGEWIRIGANAWLGERATVHIADSVLPAVIGDDVTVGRFGLVHACTVADGVVVADGATVMDGASVGGYAMIGPGSLVPPRKQLAGGWLYEGNPATSIREIGRDELAAIAVAMRAGRRSIATGDDLPPLVAGAAARGARDRINRRAYLAPTADLLGDLSIGDDAGIYFGCVLDAGDGRIVIGEESNVQDNSFLVTSAARGNLVVGRRVTIGHNVRMGSGVVEDEALIGMSSKVGDRVVVERGACVAAGAWVEPDTVVRAGWIWAGRPARAFRELKDAEREWFAKGCDVYVSYARAYLEGE